MNILNTLQTIFLWLFGTRKKYELKDLGTFDANVFSWWPDGCYNWCSVVQLPFQSEEIVILMEGNAARPYPQQESLLWKMLQNWEEIMTRLDSIVIRESKLIHKEEIYAAWQETFDLLSITPTRENDGWEMSYERRDSPMDYFCFTWRNNSVIELT